MRVTTFVNKRKYWQAQRRSDKRKGPNSGFDCLEMDVIVSHYKKNGMLPVDGICHGVRKGKELDEFNNRFGDGDKLFGTDLFERCRDDIKQCDFRYPNPEWVGKHTFLYSNSLDHTDRPRDTVRVWLDQLTDDGLSYIQWSHSHIKVRGGDCFGASMHEYIMILNEYGVVCDLLWVNRGVKIVIVTKKRLEFPWGPLPE